jgi:hypothetical protein
LSPQPSDAVPLPSRVLTPPQPVPVPPAPVASSAPPSGIAPRAHTPTPRPQTPSTPPRGITRHTTPARGAPSTPRSAPARSGAAWEAGSRARGESPWDEATDHGSGAAARTAPKGFARPLTPPNVVRPRRAATPLPVRVDGPRRRPPTDPEIETFLEIEADLPPAPDEEPDIDSAFALSALGDDVEVDGDHESVSITIEEEGRRVIETTTETEAHTLTVTVTEPMDGRVEHPRAITAEDGLEVSGTISIPEDTPPPPPRRRARRQSDGWDD